jgi:hypothetical protein
MNATARTTIKSSQNRCLGEEPEHPYRGDCELMIALGAYDPVKVANILTYRADRPEYR